MSWKHPPEICQWDITKNCNLRCSHCRALELRKIKKDLDLETVKSILGQLILLSPKAILVLAGGEPLARKDLKQILFWYNKKSDFAHIEILSNGILINEDNIKWLKGTVRGFNISLEGADEKINDAIRGKGSFKKTLKGISILTKNDLPVRVRMTFMDQKEEDVEKLMRFLPEIGVEAFNFRHVVPVGQAQGMQVSSLQYKKLSEKIWSLGKDLGLKVGFSDPFPEILVNKDLQEQLKNHAGLKSGETVGGCSAGFSLLYIDPEGIVRVCPYFPLRVSDAKKIPLEKIWFKNKILERIRWMRSSLEGKCGSCQYKFACGGCRGAALATGNIFGEDPRCWNAI